MIFTFCALTLLFFILLKLIINVLPHFSKIAREEILTYGSLGLGSQTVEGRGVQEFTNYSEYYQRDDRIFDSINEPLISPDHTKVFIPTISMPYGKKDFFLLADVSSKVYDKIDLNQIAQDTGASLDLYFLRPASWSGNGKIVLVARKNDDNKITDTFLITYDIHTKESLVLLRKPMPAIDSIYYSEKDKKLAYFERDDIGTDMRFHNRHVIDLQVNSDEISTMNPTNNFWLNTTLPGEYFVARPMDQKDDGVNQLYVYRYDSQKPITTITVDNSQQYFGGGVTWSPTQHLFVTDLRTHQSPKNRLHIYTRDGQLVSTTATKRLFDPELGSIFSSDEKYLLIRATTPAFFTRSKTTMRVVEVATGKIKIPEYETNAYAVWWERK